MVAAMLAADRRPRRSARTAGGASRLPTLVIVGEQDEPFLGAVRAHGRSDPRRRAGGDPRRRAQAAVREPRRVVAGAERLPRPRARRSSGMSDTGTASSLRRRRARGRCARYGVDEMFTLSGGHVFPMYDAAVKARTSRIVDVRHEQTATFAAEGWQADPPPRARRAHRRARRHQRRQRDHHGALQRLAAGRARRPRAAGPLGRGVLQELDHVPIVASVTKSARTVTAAGDTAKRDPARGHDGADPAPRAGVRRLPDGRDLRLGDGSGAPTARCHAASSPTRTTSSARLRCSPTAERPVLIAGTDVYWARRVAALRAARRGVASAVLRPTAWAAGACPPTTSSRSRGRAAC